jgi:hypothetical protein
MSRPCLATRVPLPRRRFLRGAGAAAIALPLLDAMAPKSSRLAAAFDSQSSPKRFVAACATLGFHCPYLFPEQTGREYTATPYLNLLHEHRDNFTVFSGLSHPEQQGDSGHASEMTWLTAAQRPGLAGFRNSISLDQMIAEKIGVETRLPFLALSTSGRSMSWTSSGVEIPGETSPARLFRSMFIEGTKDEVAAEMSELQRGRSVLDTVLGEAQRIERSLGKADRRKLEEYLTAVRDLEVRLQQSQGWTTRPKPATDAQPPRDIADKADAIGRQNLMYDMIVLALQSDSTRTVTFQLSGMNAVPAIAGVSNDWHNLSHHGKDPEKIEELKLIEKAEFAAFSRFLERLKAIRENDATLLQQTAVLFGSNLGNASSHDWHNVPVIVAGGEFRHGQHVAGNPADNTPLANLFIPLAQRMGLEIDRFGSSTSAGINGFGSVTE